MRSAALNTGSDYHLLDHIAPLAIILQIPLIVTEEKSYELALRYYPMAQIEWIPHLDLELKTLAHRFDTLFECKYWPVHLKSLFRDLFRKEMNLVFCPHGQSDKGYAARLLHPYAAQDRVLIYGNLMKKMLEELGVEARTIRLGNHRLAFYLHHRAFYDAKVNSEVFSCLSPHKRTLFYAPTWNDADQSTSFFEQTPELLAALPSDWNLIVKPHPLLEQREPSRYYRSAALIERRPGAHLITEFPLVYPLLARIDAYLGDYSSVGYDALYFKKPMFFLKQSHLPQVRLHTCGMQLDKIDSLFSLVDHPVEIEKAQAKLFLEAFGPLETQDVIRQRLLEN